MKKSHFIIGGLSLVLFCSCGTTEKSLYSWYGYEEAAYQYVKKQTPDTETKLIDSYRKITEKQKGARGTVPPGIYAESGYQLIKAGKKTEGIALLQKEIELYPESKVFIDRIIKLAQQ